MSQLPSPKSPSCRTSFCENNQLEPDIEVRNEPAIMTTGRDQQIEAAVRELLQK